MNPCGMLKNTATGRFHPIVFRYAPPPSGDLSGGFRRYKSIGHHTKGFDTLEEAITHVKEHSEWEWTEMVWEWDGEGVPAMVEWFAEPKKEVASA